MPSSKWNSAIFYFIYKLVFKQCKCIENVNYEYPNVAKSEII